MDEKDFKVLIGHVFFIFKLELMNKRGRVIPPIDLMNKVDEGNTPG